MEQRLEGEDLVYPQCGDAMTDIGTEVVNEFKIILLRSSRSSTSITVN